MHLPTICIFITTFAFSVLEYTLSEKYRLYVYSLPQYEKHFASTVLRHSGHVSDGAMYLILSPTSSLATRTSRMTILPSYDLRVQGRGHYNWRSFPSSLSVSLVE